MNLNYFGRGGEKLLHIQPALCAYITIWMSEDWRMGKERRNTLFYYIAPFLY